MATSMDSGGDRSAVTTLVELIEHHIRFSTAKRRAELSRHDWYDVTALAVRDMLVERIVAARTRFDRMGAQKLYYLSLEYLIGGALGSNRFNLGIIGSCREFPGDNGIDLQLFVADYA